VANQDGQEHGSCVARRSQDAGAPH
jgi:hypothetical protein